MKNLSYLIFGVLIGFNAYTQKKQKEQTLVWNSEVKDKEGVSELINGPDDTFFGMIGSDKESALAGFKGTKQNKFLPYELEKNFKPVSYVFLKKKSFLISLSIQKDTIQTIYLHELMPNLYPGKDKFEIGKFTTPSYGLLTYTEKRVKVAISEDMSHFAVYWMTESNKKGFNKFGYSVFNLERKWLDKGEFFLPFNENSLGKKEVLLTNDGTFTLLLEEVEKVKAADKKVNGKNTMKAIHFYTIKEDTLNEIPISTDGYQLVSGKLKQGKNNTITLVGTLASEENLVKRFSAISVFTFNTKTLKFELNLSYSLKDTIKMQLESKEPKNVKDHFGRYYQVRDIQNLEYGKVLYTVEFEKSETRINTDSKGNNYSSESFVRNDILVVICDSTGKMISQTIIEKSQTSENDQARNSSFVCYSYGGLIYFWFNDTKENYDVSGNYTSIESSKTIYSHDVLAQCVLNLEGEILSRKVSRVYEKKSPRILPEESFADKKKAVFLASGKNFSSSMVQVGVIAFKK